MIFANKIINEAKAWSYCRETSKNRSVCVDKIHQYASGTVSNDPWCSKFVTMIIDKVCKYYGLKNPIGLIASTHSLVRKAKSIGLVVDKNPVPGSIMFFPTGTNTGHVGFVVQVKPDNEIYTIEGNTTVKGGEGVGFRTRKIGKDYQFIHSEKLAGAKMLMQNGLNGFSLSSIGLVLASILLIKYLQRR